MKAAKAIDWLTLVTDNLREMKAMTELQETVVTEEPAKAEEQTETPLESVASICTVLAVGLFLMTFVFQNYVIPSGSMEKTLLVGDHVLRGPDHVCAADEVGLRLCIIATFGGGTCHRVPEAEPGDAGYGAGEAGDRGAGRPDPSTCMGWCT